MDEIVCFPGFVSDSFIVASVSAGVIVPLAQTAVICATPPLSYSFSSRQLSYVDAYSSFFFCGVPHPVP